MIPEQAAEAREVQEQQQQLRRDQISEDSVVALDRGIDQIAQNDPEVATALREVAHILTGDDRFDSPEAE